MNPNQSKGATLAITLLILFIITLIGVSSIRVTLMQEKMSTNLQDKELSFNAAETGLAAGESWLLSQSIQPAVYVQCSVYPCVVEVYDSTNLDEQSNSWWSSNSAEYGSDLDNVATRPRYIIEFLQFVPDTPEIGNSNAQNGVFYYQITARGTGSSNDSASTIQATVARRF